MPVKSTTKSLFPLLPTQVRRALPGYLLSVQCGTSQVVMLVYLNHILGTDVWNVSHGKVKRCLYTVCIHVTCLYMAQSPERKFVPSVSASSVPSVSGSPSAVEMRLSQQQQHSPHLSPSSHTPALCSSPSQQPLHHFVTITSGLKWVSVLNFS